MTTKDLTKQADYSVLIQRAIKEPGTISKCYTLFHDYSLLNTMYVAHQQMSRWGTINPIKGFRAWNDLNRKVKRGEKALEVLFPVFGSFPEKDENGEPVRDAKGKVKMIKYVKGFTPKHIHFASNQTEIMDKSKEEKKIEKQQINFDWKLACKELGIELVEYNSSDGNCQGWARVDKQQLAINPVATNPTKTAIHEIAHCIMHKDSKLPREIKEVQAESVTFIIGTMVGMSEEQLSDCRGYIQHWLRGNELDEKVAKEIMNAANKILEVGTGKKSGK